MSAYQGLKVLDCSQGLVGPMAAMLLGDFGAEVLKIEPPGGDRAQTHPGYPMWNRNKRRLVLDIDAEAGRARLEELLAAADVAILDFGPQRMRALGLMDAAERHPRLVRLWTPPYGTTGEWSELESHNAALAALTGAAFRQSSYAYQPVYLIAPIVQYAHATMAAGAAGAALLERTRSGLGQAVTVSGLNAIAHFGGATGGNFPPGRKPLGASPSYRAYECGDGQYLFLAALFSYFFQRATQAMGLSVALAEDVFPESVTQMMEARFREKSRDEWLELFEAADVPAGPVCPREDWLASDILANNDMRVVIEDPARGRIEMPGVPVKLERTPGSVRHLMREAEGGEVDAFLSPSPTAADAPPTGGRSRPLEGIKVLDFGIVLAGAFASSCLANLGAEVVKVEPTDGDPWRDRAIGFSSVNRGKRGLVVDLKQPAGREVFLDLARQADVVLDNYRVGVRERLGISHKDVMAVNPRLISCSITAFGPHGSEIKKPGFDPLLQARSGMMAAQGGDGDQPVFHIMAVNDFATAAMTVFGVITALNARERTGEGQVMNTSLASQSAIFQSGELTRWPGSPAAPKGCRDCLGISALDRYYPCADGWILIACRSAGEAAALAGALGHLEWAREFDMMAEPRDGALAEQLAETLAGQPAADALAALLAAGVRAAPALENDAESLTDPWLVANNFFDAPRETPYGPVVNRPYASFSRSESGYDRPDPGLGEHSFEVLAEWGVDPERIERLAEDGVVMCLS